MAIIPMTEVSFSTKRNMKHVSWARYNEKEEVPLIEALEQFADVCNGYFPKRGDLPLLDEYKGADTYNGQNQKIIIDDSGNLIAIIAFDEKWENPILDTINVTSADFCALIKYLQKNVARISKSKPLRRLLKRL